MVFKFGGTLHEIVRSFLMCEKREAVTVSTQRKKLSVRVTLYRPGYAYLVIDELGVVASFRKSGGVEILTIHNCSVTELCNEIARQLNIPVKTEVVDSVQILRTPLDVYKIDTYYLSPEPVYAENYGSRILVVEALARRVALLSNEEVELVDRFRKLYRELLELKIAMLTDMYTLINVDKYLIEMGITDEELNDLNNRTRSIIAVELREAETKEEVLSEVKKAVEVLTKAVEELKQHIAFHKLVS
jgi:hypothetical protein